jgi:hypothetical protein
MAAEDEELARLTSRVLATVEDLRGLALRVWDRRFQFGEQLREAREYCRGRKGAWGEFLGKVEIHPRTAREAIRFLEHRVQIEEMLRHGGEEPTVVDVRAKLSKPKPKNLSQ